MREEEKMDVLYVIGTGSVANNNELRYSLRMLERNYPNVGRVVISGNIPDFIGGDAVTVPCKDLTPEGKHWNMLHKIIRGMDYANLKEPFLISCDDHFLARPEGVKYWGVVNRGKIYTESDWQRDNQRRIGIYQKAFAKTGHILRNEGLPDVNTVWHGNMMIFPDCSDAVIDIAQKYCKDCRYGYEPMLLFNNIHLKDHKEEYISLPHDVKAGSFEKCMQYAGEMGVFSTHDKAWQDGRLLKWLQQNYKEKSKWEK